MRESSNVLTKICLFESCTFSLWYSLNHLKVLEKNSFNSWQYKKVCSMESGLRQKGHLSSEANLYFSSSFFVVIILCTTLSVNCLSLLSFVDLYILTKQSPNQEVLESFLSKPLLRRVLKQLSRWTDCNNFYSGTWLRLLYSIWQYSEVAPRRSATVEPNAFRFKSIGMAAINWK